AAVPIQPLYLALKKAGQDEVANLLPKLSQEQRESFLDLDLWHKDALDVHSFEQWPAIYAKSGDIELAKEFAQTSQFLLYLKSVCNIYTFEEEEPNFPDHDNFFQTDDHLFIVEFAEDFAVAKEVQYILKNLYADLGVEKAYALLFKIVVDSHMILTEEVYHDKKNRLSDYGFVDYYEALELRATFQTITSLNKFIKTKEGHTGNLDVVSKNQSLHRTVVSSFKTGMEVVHVELKKLKDDKRKDFLQFNFIKMVNSTIALENALKEGSVALSRVGKITKQSVELGLSYIKSFLGEDTAIFEVFDFIDLFKVGRSLLEIEQKKLKKSVGKTDFDEDSDYFYGAFWNNYLDYAFDEEVKAINFTHSKAYSLKTADEYSSWVSYNELFVSVLPFMGQFYTSLENLKKEGKLSDGFYLNYTIAEIDFESILLSSFINSVDEKYTQDGGQKMGLTISEFTSFISRYFKLIDGEHKLIAFEGELADSIKSYTTSFGFNDINFFDSYLYQVIRDNLEGYNYDEIKDEEFKHVGGPILFSN
ncbi:MAG: hypothetical protein ACI9QD_001039, partial [Thermoproteota archaeon]